MRLRIDDTSVPHRCPSGGGRTPPPRNANKDPEGPGRWNVPTKVCGRALPLVVAIWHHLHDALSAIIGSNDGIQTVSVWRHGHFECSNGDNSCGAAVSCVVVVMVRPRSSHVIFLIRCLVLSLLATEGRGCSPQASGSVLCAVQGHLER